MARPRVLLTRHLPSAVEARFMRDYEATFVSPEAKVISAVEGMDGLVITITDRLDAQTIASLPASLRIVATISVGYEHIDLDAAHARGLAITNTPDVLTDATAEIAILLMLGAARGANTASALIREGKWQSWSPTGQLGIEMTGKRLGILGMGRIGRATAKRARAFDMQIHYHNRRRLSPAEEHGAIWHASVDDLFAVSDFFSIHCASTPETRGLVNEHTLALLPHGAVVVNTARGEIVNDDALIAALQSRRVAAVGLDVFNNEPALDPRYPTLANAFLLPHIGSATVETRNAMGFRALDNLDAFFAGSTPRDLLHL